MCTLNKIEKLIKNKNHRYIESIKGILAKILRTEPQKVKSIAEDIMKISKVEEADEVYYWAKLYLGWYYNMSSNYVEAIKNHKKVNEYFEKENNLEGIMAACNGLLADYSSIGLFDSAIEYGLKGISIASKEEDIVNLIIFLINTSVAYLDSGHNKEALSLIDRLKMIPEDILKENICVLYMVQAQIFEKLNRNEEALHSCEIAYNYMNKCGYNFIEGELLSIRAEIYTNIKKYDLAINDFKKAIFFTKQNEAIDVLIRLLIRWSKYDLAINNVNKSEEKLFEALKLAKSINSIVLEKEIHIKLSEIYKSKNEFEKAYYSLEKYTKLEKEIFNLSSSAWFAKLHSEEIIQEISCYKMLYSDIQHLSNVGKKITANLNIQNILRVIYDEVRKIVKCDAFGIALYNEKNNTLSYEMFISEGLERNLGEIKINVDKNFGSYCFVSKKELLINNVKENYKKYINEMYEFDFDGKTQNSLIFCPLIIKNKVIGILTVQCYDMNAYSENDLNKLKILSSYIAIAFENANLFNEVKYLASYDSLTGTLNRREILKKGQSLLSLEDYKVKILMLDIDYFKLINDSYGHYVGDYVLKEVSKVIKSKIGEKNFVGRYGGEEFLILLSNDVNDYEEIGDEIRKAIEKRIFQYNNEKIEAVTVSIGEYEVIGDEKSFYECVKYADDALYDSKRRGRNAVTKYNRKNKISY